MRNLKKFLALVLAMMMVMGLMLTANAADVDFTTKGDVEITDYKTAVETLFAIGVLQGDKGVYDPQGTITRGEFAVMLYRLTTGETDDGGAYASLADFSDVKQNAWYAGAAGYTQSAGYLEGDNGKFYPTRKITVVEVLIGLLRAVGYGQKGEYDSTNANWSTDAQKQAKLINLVDDLTAADQRVLTQQANRAIVAQLFVTALTTKVVSLDANGDYSKTAAYGTAWDWNKMWFNVDTTDYTDGYNEDHTDAFGRPAADKVIKVDGEYVVLEDAEPVATFDHKYDANKAYEELGITKVAKDGDGNVTTKVFINGIDRTSAFTLNDGNDVKDILTTMTGVNNNLVEVYAKNGAVTTIVVCNIFQQTLTANPADDNDGKGPYIKLTGYNTGYGTTSANEKHYTADAYAKDDVVLYVQGVDPTVDTTAAAPAAGKYVFEVLGTAEVITAKMTSYSESKQTCDINGGTYYISDCIEDGAGAKAALWTSLKSGNPLTTEKTYYVGPNNGIIKVEGVDGPSSAGNYVYVVAIKSQAGSESGDGLLDGALGGAGTGDADEARVVAEVIFPDGTHTTIDLAVDDDGNFAAPKGAHETTSSADGTMADASSGDISVDDYTTKKLVGCWYEYVKVGETYTLRALDSSAVVLPSTNVTLAAGTSNASVGGKFTTSKTEVVIIYSDYTVETKTGLVDASLLDGTNKHQILAVFDANGAVTAIYAVGQTKPEAAPVLAYVVGQGDTTADGTSWMLVVDGEQKPYLISDGTPAEKNVMKLTQNTDGTYKVQALEPQVDTNSAGSQKTITYADSGFVNFSGGSYKIDADTKVFDVRSTASVVGGSVTLAEDMFIVALKDNGTVASTSETAAYIYVVDPAS